MKLVASMVGRMMRVQDRAALCRGEDARIAVGAHAAGVGTRVAIECRFVILGWLEGNHVAAVAQYDEADLFAGQELFDHERRFQRRQSGFRHSAILGDDYAFACGEAVRFDDDRVAEAVESAVRIGGIRSERESGGGNMALQQKVLCKYLAAFEACGRGGRTEDGAPSCAKRSTTPATSGASGPTTVRSASTDSARARQAPGDPSPAGKQVATRAMPGLPGAAKSRSTFRLCARRHARACSRPPPPMIRTFIAATMITMQESFDVVVIGAGHAGCEAARACARMGLRTAMVTMNLDLIAQMSCNPAIGGIAKGHLVREIDALGGVMGEVTDAVGIQFRLLNTSRGPAVWSPRAQCDKKMYRVRMREVLEREPNLRIKQAEVAALEIADGPGGGRLGCCCATAAGSARARSS